MPGPDRRRSSCESSVFLELFDRARDAVAPTHDAARVVRVFGERRGDIGRDRDEGLRLFDRLPLAAGGLGLGLGKGLLEGASPSHDEPTSLAKAVARAFRWQQMLESGEAARITDLADRVGLDRCYVPRILQLALLAPDILEAILAGRGDRKQDPRPGPRARLCREKVS